MGRIRSIKPEFFDSPSTAECTPWARLLYIAMWCMADDWGIGPANMKEMAAFAFPNDDQWTSKELPSLCKEVADNYGAMFYTHRGRPYFAVPSWDDHQVTQRRAKRRHPSPDDPESAPDLRIHDEQGTSESLQGTSLSMQGKRKLGTGEQGNRGTGDKDSPAANATVAAEIEPEPGLDPQPNAQTLVAEWIDNQDQKPPGRVVGHLSKEIKTLLEEGHPYEQVRTAVQHWHTKGVHPSVLPSVLHEIRNKRSSSEQRLDAGRAMHERVKDRAPRPTLKELF